MSEIKRLETSQLSISQMLFALENCVWWEIYEMKTGDAIILMRMYPESDLQAFLYIKLRWDALKNMSAFKEISK